MGVLRRTLSTTGIQWLARGALPDDARTCYELAMSDLLSRITSEPGKCGGRPCIRGLRFRVSDVLDLLAAGMSHEEILSEHPDLEADDIRAALEFASRRVDHPVIAE